MSGYFGGSRVGFAWSSPLWNIGIIAMFILECLDYTSGKKWSKRMILILVMGGTLFLSLVAISYLGGIDYGFARKNLATIIKVVIVEVTIMMMACNQGFDFYHKLKKCFLLFNFWGILNMVVLMRQINIKGFMMPAKWLSMNTYYEDLCAGLFGYNGTHRLGIYMTFLFLYNLYISEFEIKKKITRNILYAYNFTLLTWHFILSTKNDNMTLYILTVMFFCAYVFIDMYWRNPSFLLQIVQWTKYILVILLVVIAVLIIPFTRDFVINGILGRILKFTTVTSSTGSGSTERLSILLYSFENGFGYIAGKGIGYWPIGGDFETNDIIGFKHFGLSSMSSLVYLLGIWFYLFFVIWTSKIYQKTTQKNDMTLFIVIFLIMLFLTFYTTNLSSTPVSTTLMLIFSLFGMMGDRIRETKNLRHKKESSEYE